MRYLSGLILGVLVSVQSCGHPTVPSPVPSPPAPSPSPTPIPVFHPYDPPLKVISGRFTDVSGRDALLMPWGFCCYFVDLTDLSFDRWRTLRQMLIDVSAAGFNAIGIRLGPYWHADCCDRDMTNLRAYETVNGKADLTRWNANYWAERRSDVETSAAFKMYLELDCVDCWELKPRYAIFGPWHPANNIQGFSGGDAGIVQRSPHAHAEAFVRKLVFELGRYPNVIFQIGNECNVIGVSEAWERGIVDIIRDEERRHGYILHLIGTNSEKSNPVWADYESFHTHSLPPVKARRPTQVNEFNPAMPAVEWGPKALEMMHRGGAFAFWLSDSDDQNITAALEEGRRIRDGQDSP